jgi:YidC/Oxa1 family membrane protein insertase
MGYLLSWIYSVVGNYGITIIVFTLIVRLALFPLYASQIKNSLKMSTVQPKMQAIQRKYKNNKELLGKEMQKLYKEENYNPAKGCLPMLIQMPIIMGLFALLRNPMMFLENNTTMLLAVHESFLWMADLSQSDVWILPIAAGLTTFFSYRITMSQTTGMPGNNAGAAMAPMMKVMQVFFPVMILMMGRSVPAGLTMYWFLGNVFTIGQTFLLRKMKKKAINKAATSTK